MKKYRLVCHVNHIRYKDVNAKNEEQAENKAEDILTNGEGLKAFIWKDTIESSFDDVDEEDER